MTSHISLSPSQFPGSVEEAGALLGATITQCGKQVYNLQTVPDRMHSAFAITQPVPSQELLIRLYCLRALLRTEEAKKNAKLYSDNEVTGKEKQQSTPLVAALSLLPLLKKLIGISTQLATASAQQTETKLGSGIGSQPAAPSKRYETPPLLSTPLRKLWVDCVVACHRLGGDATRNETIQFVQQMLTLALLNPRAQKASGGVRIAALDVIAALFEDQGSDDNQHELVNSDGTWTTNRILKLHSASTTSMSQQLAPWSFDVLSVTLRSLRSAGAGEPSYRVSAVRAAYATTIACRKAHFEKLLRLSSDRGSPEDLTAWLKGAMDDKAIYEVSKVLKQAAADKFPEVRQAATILACSVAPMLILSSSVLSITNSSGSAGGATPSEQLACLDDVISLAIRNLDDESPAIATGWAEVLARCICVSIEYSQQTRADNAGNSDEGSTNVAGSETDGGSRFGGARKYYPGAYVGSLVLQLSTLPKAIAYLVEQYGKAGGELSASKAGGTYSTGGRAARLGFCIALVKVLQLQRYELGESRRVSIRQAIEMILGMANDEVEKSLKQPATQEAASSFFSTGRTWSRSDACLVLLACTRVLRQGLSEMASEATQISILQELLHLLPSANSESSTLMKPLNPTQIQVLLIEISHLFAVLGEVAATRVEEAVAKLKICLCDANHGVRHEAAIALTSLGTSFPQEGSNLVSHFLTDIQEQHLTTLQEIVVSSKKMPKENKDSTSPATNRGLAMFRRGASTAATEGTSEKTKKVDEIARPQQYAIHGKTLFISIMIKAFPKLPGGVKSEILRTALEVAEKLVSTQFDEVLASSSTGIVVSCVRAGFCIVSGILTTGPDSVESLMPTILGMWKKACQATKDGSKHWSAKYDLHSLDAILTSITSFLKYCSELLLAIPEALNKLTLMLEDVFDLVKPKGRLGSLSPSVQLVARLESAKSSLFEAFAWLPSGSFPVVSDHIFAMAVDHIKQAVEENISTSILPSLVSNEDAILDAKSFARAKREGETGGAQDIDESIIALVSEAALHGERESVVHLRSEKDADFLDDRTIPASKKFRGSSILYHFSSDVNKVENYPTPLHNVGTWRRPLDPSCSSKVRLVDAAIQAFSATFGLKDGHEQDKAMALLESLVPPALSRLTVINTSISEHDRRSKAGEDSATITNITAVLLSCLQALPLHESTHNIPIGLGPPWMNKAKDLLLTFLPIASTIVRRAAAEGLSLLATLGVTEDAHFLQSSVLHSLDEVMRNFKPDSKTKGTIPEFASSARAGSLLTLACIQRTSYKVKQKQLSRARGRILGNLNESAVDKAHENLPLLQMMTRILPSISGNGFRDFFMVKTYALHSFAILLAYSNRTALGSMSNEEKQLLLKGIELVDDNFVASWTAASIDTDRGLEADKMTNEVAFNAVLIRLMAFLVPCISVFQAKDPDIAQRFSFMTTLILESHKSHPVIMVEALAFFEILSDFRELLSVPDSNVQYSENPLFSSIPHIVTSLTPERPALFAQSCWYAGTVAPSSTSLRAIVFAVKVLSRSGISVALLTDMSVMSLLIASLEAACSTRHFSSCNKLRSISAGRSSESSLSSGHILEAEIFTSVLALLLQENHENPNTLDYYLRWILFSRHLLSGTNIQEIAKISYDRTGVVSAALSRAFTDVQPIIETSYPIRSSVKCLAAQIATAALDELVALNRSSPTIVDVNSHFDIVIANKVCAQLCKNAEEQKKKPPPSKLIFHLEDIVAAACMSCVASIDQAEIRSLQESSTYFLANLIDCFGPYPDPEDVNVSVLDQYSTQIFSSIRHALAAAEFQNELASSRLVLSGCEALFASVETKVVTEPATLRRLLRPIVPPDSSIPLLRFGDTAPSLIGYENTASSTITCAKLWTCGRLFIGNESGAAVSDELLKSKINLAVHLAAMATDGARILLGSGISLAGSGLDESDKRRSLRGASGIYYKSVSEVDEYLKALLGRTWSSCASYSIRPLLVEIISKEIDDDQRNSLLRWIKAVLPLLISGVTDCLESLSGRRDSRIPPWSYSIDSTTVLLECLEGLDFLFCNEASDVFDDTIGKELEYLIVLVQEKLLLPLLSIDSPGESGDSVTGKNLDHTDISKVCNFLCNLAKCENLGSNVQSAAVICFLKSLDFVQSKTIDLHNPSIDEIISACMKGMAYVIKQGNATDMIVRAMISIVMNSTLNVDPCPPRIKEGSKVLLRECMEKDVISLKEQYHIVCRLAATKNWEVWSEMAIVKNGLLMSRSFPQLRAVFEDSNEAKHHGTLLQSLLKLVQVQEQNDLAKRIFQGLVGEILVMLYLYGSNKISSNLPNHRTTVCADSMKLCLLAFQHFSSAGDEPLKIFLAILFPTFLAVIRYNGLPNHPSPEAHGDPTLGRVSAQAILHIARTTPASFKECVATLSDTERALLEFSVRGEMTGYVVAHDAPVKKKLNLASFKK